MLILLGCGQVEKWAEKQEAAKERREAKQQQKPDKQAALSADALARCVRLGHICMTLLFLY